MPNSVPLQTQLDNLAGRVATLEGLFRDLLGAVDQISEVVKQMALPKTSSMPDALMAAICEDEGIMAFPPMPPAIDELAEIARQTPGGLPYCNDAARSAVEAAERLRGCEDD